MFFDDGGPTRIVGGQQVNTDSTTTDLNSFIFHSDTGIGLRFDVPQLGLKTFRLDFAKGSLGHAHAPSESGKPSKHDHEVHIRITARPLATHRVRAFTIAAATIAADAPGIGFIDQAALWALPAFVEANRDLTRSARTCRSSIWPGRAAPRPISSSGSRGFPGKIADRQREVLGPLFKARIAIASVASSKNLSIVLDKRIMIVGGKTSRATCATLLTGVGDPVPPVTRRRRRPSVSSIKRDRRRAVIKSARR